MKQRVQSQHIEDGYSLMLQEGATALGVHYITPYVDPNADPRSVVDVMPTLELAVLQRSPSDVPVKMRNYRVHVKYCYSDFEIAGEFIGSATGRSTKGMQYGPVYVFLEELANP